MVLITEKLWDDDAVTRVKPDRSIARKITTTQPINIRDKREGSNKKMHKSLTMQAVGSPGTPTTPTTPTTTLKDNVWMSVFNPGSNLSTRSLGFDKPNSPSVYDWLYGGESRSEHR